VIFNFIQISKDELALKNEDIYIFKKIKMSYFKTNDLLVCIQGWDLVQ